MIPAHCASRPRDGLLRMLSAIGSVLTAPTRKSVQPTARRWSRLSLSARSSAIPAPSAPRVPPIRIISGIVNDLSLILLLLPVYLAEHDVYRADDGDDVGDHLALAHDGEGGKIDEAGPADVYARGLGAAVGFDVDAQLALRPLDGVVDLARRDVEAFGDDQEVMDE